MKVSMPTARDGSGSAVGMPVARAWRSEGPGIICVKVWKHGGGPILPDHGPGGFCCRVVGWQYELEALPTYSSSGNMNAKTSSSTHGKRRC